MEEFITLFMVLPNNLSSLKLKMCDYLYVPKRTKSRDFERLLSSRLFTLDEAVQVPYQIEDDLKKKNTGYTPTEATTRSEHIRQMKEEKFANVTSLRT